jgi:hypothetical protein
VISSPIRAAKGRTEMSKPSITDVAPLALHPSPIVQETQAAPADRLLGLGLSHKAGITTVL